MSHLRFVGAVLGCLYRERRLDAARMKAVQNARLAAMLEHAKATTPIYASRIQSTDPTALKNIQPITKTEIMARFDETIANRALTFDEAKKFTDDPAKVGRLYRGRYIIATTSGTTGRVGYFVTDREAWATLNGGLFARVLRHRLIPRELIRFVWGRRYRVMMTIATGGHFITRLVSTFQPFLSRAFMKMAAVSITRPIEETVKTLNRFRPHYLHSYPSYVEVLAREKMSGTLAIDPEFISLGSEPVSKLARERIGAAFPNAEISETYGATECLTIANQCEHGHLHVNEDLCVLEPVDEHGEAVAVGVPSAKVYVTNLLNRGQPLIRYELADSVTVLDGDCPCGVAFPMIRVEGRSDDTFYLQDADGRFRAFPPVPFEVLFLNVDGLVQYQLVHEAQNHLLVRYVVEPDADSATVGAVLKQRFFAYLDENRMGGAVKVALESVPEIARQEQGHKLRQVYSEVARPDMV